MTKIKIFKNCDNIVGVECSGHTGYSNLGNDILCASLSSIVQACYLGLTRVLNIDAKLKRLDDDGYIKFELPSDIEKEKLYQSQVLFETLFVSIEDLCKGYSKYISMEVIE